MLAKLVRRDAFAVCFVVIVKYVKSSCAVVADVCLVEKLVLPVVFEVVVFLFSVVIGTLIDSSRVTAADRVVVKTPVLGVSGSKTETFTVLFNIITSFTNSIMTYIRN